MLSRITQILVDLLSKRDAAGKKKYGVTLDRRDLTHAEWLDHATEELLDAAGYLQAAKREARQVLPHGWRVEFGKTPNEPRWKIYTRPNFGEPVQLTQIESLVVRRMLDELARAQEFNQ